MAALTPSFAVATAAGSVAGCFLYSAVKLRRTSQFFTERHGVDLGHNTALAKDFLDLNSSDPLEFTVGKPYTAPGGKFSVNRNPPMLTKRFLSGDGERTGVEATTVEAGA